MERPGEKAENKPTDGLWVVGHSKAGVRLWVLGGGSESAEVQASHGWGGRKGTRRPVRHLPVTGSFLTTCESQLLNFQSLRARLSPEPGRSRRCSCLGDHVGAEGPQVSCYLCSPQPGSGCGWHSATHLPSAP